MGRGQIPEWTVCACVLTTLGPVLILQLSPSTPPLSNYHVVTACAFSCALLFSYIPQMFVEFSYLLLSVCRVYRCPPVPTRSAISIYSACITSRVEQQFSRHSCEPSGQPSTHHPWSLFLALSSHFQCRWENLWCLGTPQTTYYIFQFRVHLLWVGLGGVLPTTHQVRISVVAVISWMAVCKGPRRYMFSLCRITH